MRRGIGLGLVVVVAILMLGIGLGGGYLLFKGGSNPSSSTPAAGTVSGLPVASTIATVQGWIANKSFTYLNFGPNTNVTAPILVFTQNGVPVPGQHNIIDVLPGQPGYSSFWRVYTVAVPSGYVANSVRSLSEALATGYTITETPTVVNCPVLNPTTVIQGPNTAVTQGWYHNETVYYWAGESNSPAFGDVVGTAPLYVFEYSNGSSVAAQMHISGVIPGETGYSDLWHIIDVVVPSNYVPNTYQSTFALLKAVSQGNATLMPTATLVNCPVVS